MTGRQAKKIVAKAKRSGMTMEVIATRICCTLSTIQKWEDDTTVSRAIAANLASLNYELGVAASR